MYTSAGAFEGTLPDRLRATRSLFALQDAYEQILELLEGIWPVDVLPYREIPKLTNQQSG